MAAPGAVLHGYAAQASALAGGHRVGLRCALQASTFRSGEVDFARIDDARTAATFRAAVLRAARSEVPGGRSSQPQLAEWSARIRAMREHYPSSSRRPDQPVVFAGTGRGRTACGLSR